MVAVTFLVQLRAMIVTWPGLLRSGSSVYDMFFLEIISSLSIPLQARPMVHRLLALGKSTFLPVRPGVGKE
jgi:hypothetical protein